MLLKQRSIHSSSKNTNVNTDISEATYQLHLQRQQQQQQQQQQQYYCSQKARVNRVQPLPSVLIDFIAMTVCDIIPPRRSSRRRSLPQPVMPELVYFIQKITYQAGISCRTALIALIYLNRAKSVLPKGAVGGYDTCHRMFLASILLASKFLQDTTWQSQSSALASYPLSNKRLSDICGEGLFSCDDINQLERAFLKLIEYQCWVDDKDVDEFVLKHRVDFSL